MFSSTIVLHIDAAVKALHYCDQNQIWYTTSFWGVWGVWGVWEVGPVHDINRKSDRKLETERTRKTDK